MDDTVTAAEANRRFSALLREVRAGRSFVVTSHGQPVARLVPVEGDKASDDAAYRAFLDELQAKPAVDVGRWTRAELYEDDA